MLGATLPIWFISMGYVYWRTSYLQKDNLSAVGLTAMHFLKLALPMTIAYLFLAYAAASDSCTIARYVVVGYLDYLWAPIVASCMLGWRATGSGWAWYRVLPIVAGAAVFVWDPSKASQHETPNLAADIPFPGVWRSQGWPVRLDEGRRDSPGDGGSAPLDAPRGVGRAGGPQSDTWIHPCTHACTLTIGTQPGRHGGAREPAASRAREWCRGRRGPSRGGPTPTPRHPDTKANLILNPNPRRGATLRCRGRLRS